MSCVVDTVIRYIVWNLVNSDTFFFKKKRKEKKKNDRSKKYYKKRRQFGLIQDYYTRLYF